MLSMPGQPLDVGGGPGGSLLDPTVALVERLVHVEFLRRARDGIVEPELHVFVERALVALEADAEIAALSHYPSRYLALAADRIDRDGRAFEAEHVQQLRDRRDLVRLFVDLDLAEAGVVLTAQRPAFGWTHALTM